MRWSLALLLLTGIAFAQSQQPSPSIRETGQPNQSKTQAAQQPTTDHDRGTRNSPLVIEMTNPPNGDAIAAEIKKNSEDQSAQDWRSIVFNSLLVAVGVLQSAALVYTALVTNKAANAAKAAAEHIPNVERAYILVKDMKAHIPPGPPWPDAVPRHVLVDISFRNYGKTPANISVAQILVQVSDHIPTDKDASRTINDPAAKLEIYAILGSGDSDRDWPVRNIPSDEPVTPQSLHQLADGTKHLYCWGKVLYRDIFGKENPTKFCFRYDMKRKEFGPVGGFERNKST